MRQTHYFDSQSPHFYGNGIFITLILKVRHYTLPFTTTTTTTTTINNNNNNVEPEMYDYTSNNWSYWNIKEKFKEKFGNYNRKTLHRFTIKDSYTWNITRNTESTAV